MTLFSQTKGNMADKRQLGKQLMQYSMAAGAALAMSAPVTGHGAIRYSALSSPIPLPNNSNSISWVQIDMEDLTGANVDTGSLPISGSGTSAAPSSSPELDFLFLNVNIAGTESSFPDYLYSFNVMGGLQSGHAVRAMPLSVDGDSKYFVSNLAGSALMADVPCDISYGLINKYVKTAETFSTGNFINASGYIGVRFNIGDASHLGWIHFNSNGSTREITGWAYDDEPDTTCQDIPTLNEWGLLILAGLILAEGARRIRRKEDAC